MGLFPTLEVQRVGLASPPIAAGVVAAAGPRVRRAEAPRGPHHLRHAGERRGAHAHRLRARLARRGLDPTMKQTDSKLLTLALLAAVAAAAVATAGCGDRPAAWSEPRQRRRDLRPDRRRRDRRRARRSRRAAGAGRRPEPAHRRRPRRAAHPERQPSPQAQQAVRAVGRPPREDRRRRARREAVADRHRTGAASARSATCSTTLTDPLAGLAIDPIEERWAVMYAGSPARNQAFVQNPNELVFLDLTQPPETATLRAHTLHSFGGRPARLTFTQTLALPGGARRLLIVESDQDLSILDLADPEQRDLRSADQRHRQPPPDSRRRHRRRRRSGARRRRAHRRAAAERFQRHHADARARAGDDGLPADREPDRRRRRSHATSPSSAPTAACGWPRWSRRAARPCWSTR